MLANQSAFTLASLEPFGDLHTLPCHDHDHTLGLIQHTCTTTDPLSPSTFIKTCWLLSLNGVHQPFWANWGQADPTLFLTVDVLHAFHKFFFDHPLKWIINIMGGNELDQCIMALQPQVAERHWCNGISKLKQVTG